VNRQQRDAWSNKKRTCGPIKIRQTDMWNNKDPTRSLVRTWYVQEPEMTMLCNKNVTRTRTITNATSYSMYTWAIACTHGKHLQRKHPLVWQPLPRMPKQFYDNQFFITDLDTSMTICWIRHGSSSMTRLLWRTVFRHKFFVKLKLWWIWLLQWQKLFVIEVDIPSSAYKRGELGNLKIYF
jgi:hypothetical protein